MNFTLNPKHAVQIDGAEASARIKGILKAAGVEAFITDARMSAVFPDGSVAFFQQLELDTRK